MSDFDLTGVGNAALNSAIEDLANQEGDITFEDICKTAAESLAKSTWEALKDPTWEKFMEQIDENPRTTALATAGSLLAAGVTLDLLLRNKIIEVPTAKLGLSLSDIVPQKYMQWDFKCGEGTGYFKWDLDLDFELKNEGSLYRWKMDKNPETLLYFEFHYAW